MAKQQKLASAFGAEQRIFVQNYNVKRKVEEKSEKNSLRSGIRLPNPICGYNFELFL